MTRHRWLIPTAALAAADVTAAIVQAWLVAALIGMALMYLAGRRDWLRIECRAVWVAAEKHYQQETRELGLQLARLERVEADRGEAEHAQIRDGGPWPVNGAGHYSPRFTEDSPAREGAGQPKQGASL